MSGYPVAGVDFRYMLTLPKMHLGAHEAWRVAHDRGLVSDEEWQWYENLIATHPCSWKGWLRYVPRTRPSDGGM